MADTRTVQIKPAKGRPMLTWVGKRALRNVTAYPAQLVETFTPQSTIASPQSTTWKDWPSDFPRTGLLFHGDNKDVLAYLLANGFRGKVKLIYIDPPFDSGADYVRKVVLRGVTGLSKIEGETYTLGEQIQYTDIWTNDSYLQFMYERLMLLKELLATDGSIWLHSDWHKSNHLRCLMDEVFSAENFVNEVIWKRADAHNDPSRFGMIHDSLFYYARSESRVWTSPKIPLVSAKLETDSHYVWDPDRQLYFRLGDLRGPGDRGPRYEYKGITRNWKWSKDKMEKADKQGLLYFTKNGIPFYRLWIENEEMPIQDIWMDVPQIKSGDEKVDYVTQKPEALLERIIDTSSNPGDIVLDCFIGAGTTAAVAQKLGRRWIAADINKGAVQTTAKRLQGIIQEQLEKAKGKKQELPGMESNDSPVPAQQGFAVYRVNDYDLQIQHNEAVNLACEFLGVTRTKTDAFFDGSLGKKLVKIIPFNHPLTPLDLEEVKRELGNRPDEERDVLVVCYGSELTVQQWLEDWNRNRKRTNLPNKIEVTDVRSDPKYGGFVIHEPAVARVSVKHQKGKLVVEINNFLSPTIVERLKQQSGVLTPQITDWRSMVDSVMIDTAYDGKVFNIVLADVPGRKDDLVAGRYEVEAPKGKTTVAVKVTDMLGEEVIVVREV